VASGPFVALPRRFSLDRFMLASVRRLPAWWASARTTRLPFSGPIAVVLSVFLIYPAGSEQLVFARGFGGRRSSASLLFLQGFHTAT